MADDASRYLRSVRNILIIMLVVVAFSVLRELAHLLIPLVLAGLLTVLNLPMVSFLERRRVPRVVITLIVAILTIAVVWGLVSMIGGTVEQIVRDRNILARQFTRKVDLAIVWVDDAMPGVNVDYLREEINRVLSPTSIAGLIATALGALGDIGSSSVIFVLYYLILLSGATGYHAYVDYVSGSDESEAKETREVWMLTQESISVYMGIKTVISLITGIIAGLICTAFGLQFAVFWGFMTFLLNYIPSIGSILATALPVFMAVIQFDSFGIILALAILLGAFQFAIGSVIDPMIMGNRLRLNTVTVIFGLLFWGYIWGIPGMLLSVPLMVMMRLFLERSEDLSIVARIMGNPGKPGRKKPALYTRIINNRKTRPRKDEEETP